MKAPKIFLKSKRKYLLIVLVMDGLVRKQAPFTILDVRQGVNLVNLELRKFVIIKLLEIHCFLPLVIWAGQCLLRLRYGRESSLRKILSLDFTPVGSMVIGGLSMAAF